MRALGNDVRRLIGVIERQNEALRRGDRAALCATTDETRRLTALLEEGFGDARGLLPHGSGPMLRRLRRLLDENAQLLEAARAGAQATRRGGAVGYDASGSSVREENPVALTRRSPTQL